VKPGKVFALKLNTIPSLVFFSSATNTSAGVGGGGAKEETGRCFVG
jgi:hypothetical protein